MNQEWERAVKELLERGEGYVNASKELRLKHRTSFRVGFGDG